MSNSSELFLYTTICSSFKWIERFPFELSCTQTQTDRQTHTHTDGHEYSIVAVDTRFSLAFEFIVTLSVNLCFCSTGQISNNKMVRKTHHVEKFPIC